MCYIISREGLCVPIGEEQVKEVGESMCYSLTHEGLSHNYASIGKKQVKVVGEGLPMGYSLSHEGYSQNNDIIKQKPETSVSSRRCANIPFVKILVLQLCFVVMKLLVIAMPLLERNKWKW